MRRALKYLNILILVMLLAAAAVVYWFAYRPLPETSGTLRGPVSARATIVRDEHGIPHITAATAEDAIVLQGFACAQDRMWQMDGLRRAAAGRLAEVFGPSVLEVDRSARRLRMERAAEQHAAALPPADRAVLAAYARGVNYYLETHRNRMPLEFRLLGYDARPWTVADSVLIGMLMYRDLTTTWPGDLEKAALLAAGGDRAKVAALYPASVRSEVMPGSNAWAVAGSRTASGKPLLANDPHLEYSMPGIWHAVHLKAPGLNVIGAALPGAPCVILGHNDRIAWGVTNLGYDVQDLYIEKFDPQLGRYVYRGQVEQARLERDPIRVKGGATVDFAQWVTRHGPVSNEGGRFLALRWVALESGSFGFPFLDLDRARNWQEFTAALARYPGPGQNFVYADVDGNIGYQATGRLPIRRNFDGDVPVDGASGEYEWDGYIPFEQLPRAFNPPSGIIVTANQNPFPADYPYRVGGEFAAPYRARQIRDLLAPRRGLRPADMIAIQKDVYSPYLHAVARAMVEAWSRRRARGDGVGEAIDVLRNWNGQVEKGTAAPVVASLAAQHLRRELAERALAGKPPGPARIAPAASVIESLLRSRPKDWFADWDQALMQALQDALEEGRRMQGRAVRQWNWGALNSLLLAHPVGSHLPLVARYFDIGPVPQSGAATTVKQTTRRLGPSLRMVSDFADWDRSLFTLVAGVSGHVLSSHYKDYWRSYYAGRGEALPFREVRGSTLMIEPR